MTATQIAGGNGGCGVFASSFQSSDRGFVAPTTGTVIGNTVIASGGGLYHFPGTDLVIKCSHEKMPGAQDAKYVSWLVRATYDLQ